MNVQAMDLPINVEVKCCGRTCGRSTHIVLNPVTKEITHLVIKQRKFPYTQRLVPVNLVEESTPRMIRLRRDAPDLNAMQEFTEMEFVQSEETHMIDDPFLMWPFTYTTVVHSPHVHERIPVGELAIRRGARVIARDGQVGQIDEFVVDQGSEHIMHLVMRHGHLWDQQDVTIPVCYIERIEDDAVYLNIDKASIAALPAIPVHRE